MTIYQATSTKVAFYFSPFDKTTKIGGAILTQHLPILPRTKPENLIPLNV